MKKNRYSIGIVFYFILHLYNSALCLLESLRQSQAKRRTQSYLVEIPMNVLGVKCWFCLRFGAVTAYCFQLKRILSKDLETDMHSTVLSTDCFL